jgi:hypothetical protein
MCPFKFNDEISNGKFIGYVEQNKALSMVFKFKILNLFKFSFKAYFLVVENRRNSRKRRIYIGDTYGSPKKNGFVNFYDEQKLEIYPLAFTEKGLEARINYSGICGPGVNDESWNYQKDFLISRKKFPK